jgi:transposase
MEHDIYRLIRRTLRRLGRRRDSRRFVYTDAGVLEVYLWAALHERPVCWACDPANWPPGSRRGPIPSPTAVCRRMRTRSVKRLFDRLLHALRPRPRDRLVACLDGKSLPIGPHSHDRQSGYGRAASGKARGYKLHAITDADGHVLSWRVAPMNVDERTMARRMLRELDHTGYLLADKNYDAGHLFEAAAARGIQFVTPRRYGPGKGLGHRQQHPGRLRSIEITEHDHTGFGRELVRQRWSIERFFGLLSSHPCGLGHLPAWVRGWRRVHNHVAAKLVIIAAVQAIKEGDLMQ